MPTKAACHTGFPAASAALPRAPPDLVGDFEVDPAGRASEAFPSDFASADFVSEDFASVDFAFDAIGFFVALELVLLGRSDLFVPTSYLFFSSTV